MDHDFAAVVEQAKIPGLKARRVATDRRGVPFAATPAPLRKLGAHPGRLRSSSSGAGLVSVAKSTDDRSASPGEFAASLP